MGDEKQQSPTGTSAEYMRPPDAQPVRNTDLNPHRPPIGNTGNTHLLPESPAVPFPTPEELRSLSAQKSSNATQFIPEEITALNKVSEIPPIQPGNPTHIEAIPPEHNIDPTIKPFDPTAVEAPQDDYEEILPNGRVAGIRQLLGRVPEAVEKIDLEIAAIQAFLNDPRLKKAEDLGLIQINPSTEDISQAALSLIAEKLAGINADLDKTTANLLPKIDAAVARASDQVTQLPTPSEQIKPAPDQIHTATPLQNTPNSPPQESAS